uniref:Uncharacterized protein n=1 Tax=Anguilla anguilla TaxID=7936 RepID=A0A0E9WZ40_ANGAN
MLTDRLQTFFLALTNNPNHTPKRKDTPLVTPTTLLTRPSPFTDCSEIHKINLYGLSHHI